MNMNDTFYKTVIHSPQWKEWCKEVRRRMDYHNKRNSKVYKGCWDIDECVELGIISPEHFQDFIKFIKN